MQYLIFTWQLLINFIWQCAFFCYFCNLCFRVLAIISVFKKLSWFTHIYHSLIMLWLKKGKQINIIFLFFLLLILKYMKSRNCLKGPKHDSRAKKKFFFVHFLCIKCFTSAFWRLTKIWTLEIKIRSSEIQSQEIIVM